MHPSDSTEALLLERLQEFDEVRDHLRHKVAVPVDGTGQAVLVDTPERLRQRSVELVLTSPERKLPPETRQALTHKFRVGGFKGYLTVGLYDDGRPCEIFIKMAKMGSTLQGFADAWATSISIMVQHGITLRRALEKHVGARFEPHGLVDGAGGESASSIVDYVARWMLLHYDAEWAAEQGEMGRGGEWTVSSESIKADPEVQLENSIRWYQNQIDQLERDITSWRAQIDKSTNEVMNLSAKLRACREAVEILRKARK